MILPKDENLARAIEFTIEMDKMKSVFRRSSIFDGSRHENDAEHSYHIALMALAFEKYAPEGVDLLRVLKMLLVHDIVEIDAGDTFAYDKAANLTKKEREAKAADRLFAMLENGAELRALWEEFDAMESADALYAISLDRLQPFLANCLNKGDTWFAGGVGKEAILKRMAPVQKGIPALWETVLALIEENVENGYVCEK
ncbi:MAG: HD domain-containing protein [Clostridia bacterium]|nr:HD domain-containing protein [Clostridia bacterium]